MIKFILAIVLMLTVVSCGAVVRPIKYNTTCIDGVVHWNLKNLDGEAFYVPFYTPDGSVAKCPKTEGTVA